MTRRPERADYDAAHKELRRFLHAWDPIGISEFPGFDLQAPADMYDSLIPGLHRRLREGDSEQEIQSFLAHELVAISDSNRGPRSIERSPPNW